MSVGISEVEQIRLIDYFFDTLHPELCKDDHNLYLVSAHICEKTRGMAYINIAALEWAIADLKGQLHYYAGVDMSAQLAAGAEAEKKLAEERAEKDRAAKALERRLRLEQEQRNRTPMSAAYEGSSDRAESERQTRLKAQKVKHELTLRARHVEFDQLVREARMESSAEIHSRREGKFAQLYARIKKRFPESEFQAAL